MHHLAWNKTTIHLNSKSPNAVSIAILKYLEGTRICNSFLNCVRVIERKAEVTKSTVRNWKKKRKRDIITQADQMDEESFVALLIKYISYLYENK